MARVLLPPRAASTLLAKLTKAAFLKSPSLVAQEAWGQQRLTKYNPVSPLPCTDAVLTSLSLGFFEEAALLELSKSKCSPLSFFKTITACACRGSDCH